MEKLKLLCWFVVGAFAPIVGNLKPETPWESLGTPFVVLAAAYGGFTTLLAYVLKPPHVTAALLERFSKKEDEMVQPMSDKPNSRLVEIDMD
jgi:hypothetical protein